jgi:hypothetical protein
MQSVQQRMKLLRPDFDEERIAGLNVVRGEHRAGQAADIFVQFDCERGDGEQRAVFQPFNGERPLC